MSVWRVRAAALVAEAAEIEASVEAFLSCSTSRASLSFVALHRRRAENHAAMRSLLEEMTADGEETQFAADAYRCGGARVANQPGEDRPTARG